LVDLGVVTKAYLTDENHFQREIGDTTAMLDTGFRHDITALKTKTAAVSEVSKAPLTMQRRRGLKSSDFAIPEKAPGPGSYPIQSRHQAGIALALAAMHGEDLSRVQSAVYAKYPEMKKVKKSSESVGALTGFRFPELINVSKATMCDCCQKGGCDCKPGCKCCTPACFASFDTDAT
jgi:hypothetical protein